MANSKEKNTDFWVRDLLKEADLDLEPQGSSVKEIAEALKTASKRGTGNAGYPEFVGVVKDYIIVIEDKKDIEKRKNEVLSLEVDAVTDYAMNGALFYAQHLAKNTAFKKIIAFGISGSEKRHKISPIYVDDTEYYRELPEVESFISFNEENIEPGFPTKL